jgi:ribosomal protein S14
MLRYYYRKYRLLSTGSTTVNNRSRIFFYFYFYFFLLSDARVPQSAKFQFMRKILYISSLSSSTSRARSRNFCSVSGFPRGISSSLLLFSRHEYNRRVVSGRIPGFKKA